LSQSNPALVSGVRQQSAPPPAPKMEAWTDDEKPIWKYGYVHIGMTVLWWPNGNSRSKPKAAIVTDIGALALDLHVIEPASDRLNQVLACHHMSANVPEPVRAETGGWDHTPSTKALFELDPDFRKYPEQIEREKRYAKSKPTEAPA